MYIIQLMKKECKCISAYRYVRFSLYIKYHYLLLILHNKECSGIKVSQQVALPQEPFHVPVVGDQRPEKGLPLLGGPALVPGPKHAQLAVEHLVAVTWEVHVLKTKEHVVSIAAAYQLLGQYLVKLLLLTFVPALPPGQQAHLLGAAPPKVESHPPKLFLLSLLCRLGTSGGMEAQTRHRFKSLASLMAVRKIYFEGVIIGITFDVHFQH